LKILLKDFISINHLPVSHPYSYWSRWWKGLCEYLLKYYYPYLIERIRNVENIYFSPDLLDFCNLSKRGSTHSKPFLVFEVLV